MAKNTTIDAARAYIDLPDTKDGFGIDASGYIRLLLTSKNNGEALGFQSAEDYRTSAKSFKGFCQNSAPYTYQFACFDQMTRRNMAAAERAVRLAIVNA